MRTTKDEWAKRVERWQDSGLSSGEFAAETGINPRSLMYWKWRLKKESRDAGGADGAPPPSSRGPRQPRRRGPVDAEAVPLPLVELKAAATDGRFELELGNGRRVRVPSEFEPAALQRLLTILEAS
jgi:transposase